MTSLILFGSFFLFLFLSVPIAYALGLSSLLTILLTKTIDLTFLTSSIVTSLDSFPLMAVPFFILAGDILILTPILWPVARALDVNIIHFGIVMVVNLSIGFVTPPVGVNLYVGTSMSGISLSALVKKIIPFFCVMMLALVLITYIPQLSLFFA